MAEDRLTRLERQLRGIEQEVGSIASIVASNQPENKTDDGKGAVNPDYIWACRKCGARLGFYDPEEDMLRIRYKDFVVFMHIGAGGYVQVLCRSCSEMNQASWEPEALPVAKPEKSV